MIIEKVGLIKKNFHCLGFIGYPVFMLKAPKTVLFEAGITCVGKMYAQAVRTVLGSDQPVMLFLTHSHWDHCGAVSYLKAQFPSMQVAASSRTAEVLKRPNAQELMARLNRDAKTALESLPGFDALQLLEDPFRPFSVDVELEDGQILDLGEGATVEVLATPGHTRDNLAFYLPREKALIPGEAAGLLLPSGHVTTEFVADYDAYIASIRRMADLPVEILCQAHRLIQIGREEISSFLKRSIEETILFKDRAYQLLDEEDGSIEPVVQRIKAERYDPIKGVKQPEIPYLLNVTGQVKHLAARRAEDKLPPSF